MVFLGEGQQQTSHSKTTNRSEFLQPLLTPETRSEAIVGTKAQLISLDFEHFETKQFRNQKLPSKY